MSNQRNVSKNAKKGDRSFIAILGIVLIVGVAAIGFVVTRSKAPAAVVLDPNAPLPAPQGIVAGSETAPVEIVEFGDFECPACGMFATITEPDVRKRLVDAGLVRFRYIDFPLNGHPSTLFAHNAAACANEQGKFWQFHDRVYYGQNEWSQFANGRDMNPPKIMKRYAKELGLDTKQFGDCFDARKFDAQIRANAKEGERLGVNTTPTFFIGNRKVVGAQGFDYMKAVVDSVTAEAAKAAPGAKKGTTDAAPPAAAAKK